MKIAVLIPCYNEEKTVRQVVESYKQHLPEADIYVYDNNSTDETATVARQAGAIVKKETRQGKGNVIRTMFREVIADCYLIVDGDDTYPAEFAPQMCADVLENGADMVIGDRLSSTYFTENKRPFHNTGNVLVRKLVNAFFRGNITDIMTGYRAFSPLFVKSFPVLSKGFEIETEMSIHALDKNLNITAIPVTYRDRPDGSESKLNTFTDGFKVLFTIVKLFKDYRPLPFFSIISGFLTLLAAWFAVPVIAHYFSTRMVDQIPTLIVAGFVVVAALLLFSCGLILDTENKKARQSFEVQLNMITMLQNIYDDKNDKNQTKMIESKEIQK